MAIIPMPSANLARTGAVRTWRVMKSRIAEIVIPAGRYPGRCM